MRAVVPWWSGDGHRQRQCAHHRPWSSASVKNFHRSLIPLPSLRLISVALPFPLPLSSPILHTSLHLEDSPSSRKKTDTSRRKSESYFPGCSFSKLLFFLASSSSSSYLASPARSKLQEDKERWGEGRKRERGSWQSLRRGRITRGQDGRRLVRILFPKCG